MDFKILHGCGHSFHSSYFPHGPGICTICKVEIQDALTTLSETASQAIRNINVKAEQEDVQDREEEDEDDDADDGYNPHEHDEASLAESTFQITAANIQLGDLLKIHNFLIFLIPGAQLGWVLGVWTPLPLSAKERIYPFCSALSISIH